MSRHRDFDAARAERALEPLTFTLGGQQFTTVPEIPVGPLLDLASKAGDTDAAALAAFGAFMRAIVAPGDRDRFEAVLAATGIATMLELVAWVIEETTGGPLPGASSSPEAPSADGEPSRVVSLSPAPETRSA